MEFFEPLVKPSPQILDALERGRARLLTVLLIGRGVGLACLIAFFAVADFVGLAPAAQTLYTSFALNFVAYAISRTRHFRWAAYLIIFETVIAVPYLVYRLPYADVIAAAPYWMTFGTLLSSLVLPVRQTILITIISSLSFLLMSFVIPAGNLPALGASLVFFGLCSLLGAIGTAMRDQTERTPFVDRRGPLAIVTTPPKSRKVSGR